MPTESKSVVLRIPTPLIVIVIAACLIRGFYRPSPPQRPTNLYMSAAPSAKFILQDEAGSIPVDPSSPLALNFTKPVLGTGTNLVSALGDGRYAILESGKYMISIPLLFDGAPPISKQPPDTTDWTPRFGPFLMRQFPVVSVCLSSSGCLEGSDAGRQESRFLDHGLSTDCLEGSANQCAP